MSESGVPLISLMQSTFSVRKGLSYLILKKLQLNEWLLCRKGNLFLENSVFLDSSLP